MRESPAFGTPVLVRAEIARVVGSHVGGIHTFKQRTLDTKRWAAYVLKGSAGWPGVGVPAELADTPEDWDLEPMPNGNAVVRCRRLALQTPAMGFYIGTTHIVEGTLVASSQDQIRPWRKRDLVDRRRLQLYEIATPPTRQGRGRVVLVHPYDAQVVPLTMTKL